MKTSVGDLRLNPKIKCFFLGHHWIFNREKVKHECLRCKKPRYKEFERGK